MVAFWQDVEGRKVCFHPYTLNQYCAHFYCTAPRDREHIWDETISDLVKKGLREIDVRLYNRVECFDFWETIKLLKGGAKTDINISDHGTIMDRISEEYTFLASCQIVQAFELFEKKSYEGNFDMYAMLCDLISFVAHKEMYYLLVKYSC